MWMANLGELCAVEEMWFMVITAQCVLGSVEGDNLESIVQTTINSAGRFLGPWLHLTIQYDCG